jgi:hypothetical protein
VGPAYTERVLYCHISPKGKVELVDSLGIKPSTRGEGVRATSFPIPPKVAVEGKGGLGTSSTHHEHWNNKLRQQHRTHCRENQRGEEP